jgi:glycosyltransferase involved in cell wall biosynthesis
MACPELSVLLPVYNGVSYLREAIESILGQTYTDFELIVIDDGSTDDSLLIIGEFADSRIRVFSQTNMGLAASLNRAIELAKGRYVARQDQDDISFPQRFEKQMAFLEAHPDYGMVGTWAEIWIGDKKTRRAHKHPSDNLTLKFDLLFNNPFVHSSMMLRKSVFDEIGLYTNDKSRRLPEDYELWSRIARKFKVANIPELLQVYREVPGSISRNKINPLLDRAVAISRENLAWLLGATVTEQEVTDLAALMNGRYHLLSTKPNLQQLSRLVMRAAETLSDVHLQPTEILRKRAMIRLRVLKNHYLSYNHRRLSIVTTAFSNIVRKLTGWGAVA